MHRPDTRSPWFEDEDLAFRSTRAVIEDHIRLQIAGQLEEDLRRNYAADAVILTGGGRRRLGHEAIRSALGKLYRHAPGSCYELVSLEVSGDYGLLVWKASALDYAVDSAADSFVVRDGRIRMQTSHCQILECAD